MPGPVLIVLDSPNAEEALLGEPLRDREGELFRRLLADSGLEWRALFLGDPGLKAAAVGAAAVVPAGEAARAFFRSPLGADLKAWRWRLYRVGYMRAPVAPWYSPAYVLSHGKAAREATGQFFRTLKEATC